MLQHDKMPLDSAEIFYRSFVLNAFMYDQAPVVDQALEHILELFTSCFSPLHVEHSIRLVFKLLINSL